MIKNKRRGFFPSWVWKTWLVVYLFSVLVVFSNGLPSPRATIDPFDLHEIKDCFLETDQGRLMLEEFESLGVEIIWEEVSPLPEDITFSFKPLPFLIQAQYRPSTKQVEINNLIIRRHIVGCRGYVGIVSHELQHALQHLTGTPYDEIEAFARGRSVRFNFPYNGKIDSISEFIVRLTYGY